MDPATVERLLGWTALHRAAFRGHVDAARAALDGGTSVDATAIDGWTPLMSACLEGHAAIVRLLRGRGAKAELAPYEPRLTTLACASGNVDTARAMHDGPPNQRDAALFFLATYARMHAPMRKVTDAGSSDGDMVGYSTEWNERWEIRTRSLALDDDAEAFLGDLVQPIHDGVRVGGIDIEMSDDVSTPAPRGLCSDYARSLYVHDLAPHLLGDRAQPIERLRDLLERAVRLRHVDVVDALLPHAGKPMSALLAAVSADDGALVARLLEDPNAREGGRTALGAAAAWTKPHAAHALLERGAKVERGGGDTPLVLAVENVGPAALDMVILLIEHGAKVDAPSKKKGWTPLMRAALMGDAKIVERLLRAGADPNAVDKHGMTPLKHAAVGKSIKARDHDEIVELLRGYGAK